LSTRIHPATGGVELQESSGRIVTRLDPIGENMSRIIIRSLLALAVLLCGLRTAQQD
jgi:hypothetical protein